MMYTIFATKNTNIFLLSHNLIMLMHDDKAKENLT